MTPFDAALLAIWWTIAVSIGGGSGTLAGTDVITVTLSRDWAPSCCVLTSSVVGGVTGVIDGISRSDCMSRHIETIFRVATKHYSGWRVEINT
jgi:hypothetical protein